VGLQRGEALRRRARRPGDCGGPMGNLHMMIAAHALAEEAVLVTNDRSFRRLKGLKIEDWTK
jgi:predicted nucleic acid-binding protein